MMERLHFKNAPSRARIIQLLVFAVLVVLLWQVSDGWTALALLQSADPAWLVAAAIVLTLQTLLSAQRWRITAAQLGLSITPMHAIREYYLAQVVNQSLPGGVVGDAGRAVRARGKAGLMISGQAVLFERVAGQIGLLAVLIFGLAVTLVSPSGITFPDWVLIPLTITLAALVILPLLLIWIARFAGPSAQRLTGFLSAFSHAVVAPGVRGPQILLSLGTAICNVFAFAFCAAAIGQALPVVVAATLVPLILFAMVLPFSIGGWGVREGAAVLLFPVIGATASEGLAASVAFGLVFLLTILPGLALSWMQPATPAIETR